MLIGLILGDLQVLGEACVSSLARIITVCPQEAAVEHPAQECGCRDAVGYGSLCAVEMEAHPDAMGLYTAILYHLCGSDVWQLVGATSACSAFLTQCSTLSLLLSASHLNMMRSLAIDSFSAPRQSFIFWICAGASIFL